MAELGDYLQQGVTSGKEVTVEMMEYKYVETCEDPAELRAILNRLRSKEEGYYPHLETTVENKLMGLIPEKERKKVLALRSGPDAHDISEAGAALSAWAEQVRVEDKSIEDDRESQSCRPLPPVRGQKGVKTTTNKQAKKEVEKEVEIKSKTPSSHVYDAPDYFRKWDAYDAEAEENAIEAVEVEGILEAEKATKAHEAKEKGRAARREAELADLRGKMSWASMSKVQRNRFALLEKNKGNECFKTGEPEEAMHFYSRALALIEEDHEQACILWANRAMAALKVGLLERAEEDCSRAIQLNPTYYKARLRRGMTRHKRGKYAAAVEDFDFLLQNNAPIEDVAKLRERSYQKQLEVDGESSGVKIVEMSSTMAVPLKEGPPPILDNDRWERKPFILPSDQPIKEVKAFTKIAINVDDSSDESSEEEEEEEEGMSRVPIIEDDSSSEEEGAEDSGDHFKEEGMSEWDASNLKQKAVGLFMRSQYPEATALFQQALGGLEQAALEQSKPVSSVFGNMWHALRNNLAACALAMEQWSEVIVHCDAVLHDQPANLKALLRRAEARERLGLTAGACSDIQAALRIDPNNIDAAERLKLLSSMSTPTAPAAASEAAKLRGNEAMARGAWSEAWELYTDALVHDPSNFAARNNRCMCALKQDKWKEAESDASGVLALSPENSKALFRRASARQSMENYEGSEADLLATLVVEPTNGKAKELLLKVRKALVEKEAQQNQAKATRIQIVDEDDDDVDEPIIEDVPRSTRVQIVDEDEDSDEAEEQEAKATRVQIVDEDEDSDEAEEQEAKATRVQIVDEDEDSDEAEEQEAKATRVQIVDEDEDSDEDFSPYSQEVAMRSDDCKQRGNVAMSGGDFALAEKCYTQALKFDSTNTAARNNRSVAYLKLAKFAEAHADTTAVLTEDDKNLKALMRRAEACVGLSDTSGAIRDLEAVLRVEPNNEEAATRLAEAKGVNSTSEVAQAAHEEPIKDAVVPESPAPEPLVPESESEPAPVQIPTVSSDRSASDAEKVLGNQKLGSGSLQEAESHYTRAIELDASNMAAFNNRSLCRLKQKNWAGSIADATTVLEKEDKNHKALLRRSQAHEALGRMEEARADLVAVLKIDPKHKEANARFVALTQKKMKTPATPLVTPIDAPPATTSSALPKTGEVPVKQVKKEKKETLPKKPLPVRNIKVKLKVPSEAPTTISELERNWRELKAQPELLATYLKVFKVGTFKKLFKESISPDIIPQLLSVTATQLCDEASECHDPSSALRVMKGLTKSKSFSFTLMLLSDADKVNVGRTLDVLGQQRKHTADVAELRSQYNL